MVLSKVDAQKIFEEVKANHAMLDACSGPHTFEPIEGTRHRFRCGRCGGEVSFGDALWYKRGLEHGRRDAED